MIYLDNAATSFPKAPGVSDRMKYYLDSVGASINRGVYASAQEAGLETLLLRERLCGLFHHPDPTHVLLTSGATAALNLAIKGFLRPGDRVLVSSMEHNAVMRPLVQLGGLSVSRATERGGSILKRRKKCCKRRHACSSSVTPRMSAARYRTRRR